MFFNHRTERLSSGKTYHFVDQLPSSSPKATLICIHGFPDTWYGWRRQIQPWSSRGYRVIVPDMLGYGDTDKPKDVSHYTTKSLCNDLVALLDLLNIKKAVVIGHDWGSYIAGRFALWHSNRLEALVLLSVPFVPPIPKYFSLEELASHAPNLGYQLYLSHKQSTHEVEENLHIFLDIIFQNMKDKNAHDFSDVDSLPRILADKESHTRLLSVLGQDEMDYYRNVFAGNDTMDGPLNYYRTSGLRYQEEKSIYHDFKGLPSDLPVLFLCGSLDMTSRPNSAKTMERFVPRLESGWISDVGHWLMVEATEEVNSRVITFIEKHLPHSKL